MSRLVETLVRHPCPRGCGAEVLVALAVSGSYEPASDLEPGQSPEIEADSAPQCLGEPPCRFTLEERWDVQANAIRDEDARLYGRYLDDLTERFAAIRRMGRGPV